MPGIYSVFVSGSFSVLVTIFETDIDTTKWNRTLSPHVSDFMNYLWPKLEILYNIAPSSNGLSSEYAVVLSRSSLLSESCNN